MTKFIAEISSNHNNNEKRIEKLIQSSAKAGFYAVKFQLFKIDKLFSQEVLKKSKSHRDRRKWELDIRMIDKIVNLAKKNNIKVGFTPFDLDSFHLIKNKSDFFKISSYDLLRHEFINEIINHNKLTIISTGMSSKKELSELKKLLSISKNKKIVVMHCRSLYPCNPQDAHLNFINYLRRKFKFKVGWSDHTNNIFVLYEAAINLKSDFIELHVDLDDFKGFEGNVGHCYSIKQVKALIEHVKIRKKILGNNKFKILKLETNESDWRADPEDGLRPFKKIRKLL